MLELPLPDDVTRVNCAQVVSVNSSLTNKIIIVNDTRQKCLIDKDKDRDRRVLGKFGFA